jgi:uncharacterized membrane protein
MKQVKDKNSNITLQQTHAYSGPIPDPESLAKYEQIQPGFAERIMVMAEEEAKHRRNNENRIVRSSIKAAMLGIVCAFISVAMFGGLILFALIMGYSMATLGLAIGAIASVAGIFIVFKSKNKAV